MSAKKFGRLAGLAFVLLAAFGGVAVAGAAAHAEPSAVVVSTLDYVWQ